MLGQALGLTDAEFDALQGDYRQSALFNEREKAVLAWAEAMTLNTAKQRFVPHRTRTRRGQSPSGRRPRCLAAGAERIRLPGLRSRHLTPGLQAVSSNTLRGTSDVACSFCSEASLLATQILCKARKACPHAVSRQNQFWIASASGVPGRAAAAS